MTYPLKNLIEQLPPEALTEHTLSKDEFLFRQQQPANAIFAVLSGRIRLFRDLPDGSSVILHVARRGDTFAEASLFAEHYHCHAQADLATTVVRVNSHHLLAAISADKSLGLQFSRTLAAQVRDMRAMLSLRDVRSADERLLAWLRLKAQGENMSVLIDRPWASISEELGLTKEAVYRALANLQQQGRIDRQNRRAANQFETIFLLKGRK